MILFSLTRLIENKRKHKYFETYWAFDLHGTIIKPNHQRGNIELEFYPHAKETLQMLSARGDIRMILTTCSYPEEIEEYLRLLANESIIFNYVNENPEINEKHFGYYADKWYYDILFEDKGGFDIAEWKDVFEFMKDIPIEFEDNKRDDIVLVGADRYPIRLDKKYINMIGRKGMITSGIIKEMKEDRMVPQHMKAHFIKSDEIFKKVNA